LPEFVRSLFSIGYALAWANTAQIVNDIDAQIRFFLARTGTAKGFLV